MQKSQIPREAAAPIADLARRTGLYHYGLKILNPILHPLRRDTKPATLHERASYAALLAKHGLAQEALELLAQCEKKSKEIVLFSGFAEMNQWSYKKARSHFLYYIKHFQLSDYERAIAQLNLAACYLFTDQSQEAEKLLVQLREECERMQWTRLLTNTFELSAQNSFRSHKWTEGLSFLDEASRLAPDDGDSQLFVEKWKAITNLRLQGPKPLPLEILSNVRERALQTGSWETVRDCDFHLACALCDQTLAAKIYFGTPFDDYRVNLLKETRDWFSLPEKFIWTQSFSQPSKVFDLQTGREVNGAIRLRPGQALHRMLQSLARDLYKPQSTGSLFTMVFSGEYFNPATSPQRVFQLAYRLRHWLQAQKIPIQIQIAHGYYHMLITGDYGLVLNSPQEGRSGSSPNHALLGLLKQKWPYQSFSSAQAIEILAISPRSARLTLRQAVSDGKLKTSGRGRSTIYRFAK